MKNNNSIKEKKLITDISGYAFLLVACGLLAGIGYLFSQNMGNLFSNSKGYWTLQDNGLFLQNNWGIILTIFAVAVFVYLIFKGLTVIAPNEGVVTTFLGTYMGSAKKSGLRFIIPFYRKKKISLRSRNLNGQTLKVNDKAGNPIEIAAVIVWQVNDTAKAMFDVDDYELFVAIQSEAAVRNLATSYAYDHKEDDQSDITLRDGTGHINEKLTHELNERLFDAGVQVIEARISHLAYAPEIAMAMLQRQQATAVVSARKLIVEGAVGMVEMALHRLEEKDIVKLGNDERAQLVSSLLVVLCSEGKVTPTVSVASSSI